MKNKHVENEKRNKKGSGEKAYRKFQKVLPVLAGALVMTCLSGNTVFAEEAAAGGDPLAAVTALKVLFLGILSGIGVIIAAKNGFEMFQAYQQQDSAGMSSALKGVIGGVGMAGIGGILALMGL